jgi:AraC-like DNA-binding protein
VSQAEIKAYYPAPPVEQPAPRIRRIGIRELMPPGMVDRPRGTDDILMMVFHGDACIGSRTVQPGPSMRIWPRRASHLYGDPRRPWMHSWLHLQGQEFESALVRERIPLDQPISSFAPEPFEHVLRLLHVECGGRAIPDAEIVYELTRVLIRLTRRCTSGPGGTALHPALSRLCLELHQSPGAPWSILRMARMCGWSASRFAHRFKTALGVPPLEYLIRLRLHRARERLVECDRPIHAIAGEVGYPDLPHFSRIFKARFGLSPGRVRRR